MLMTEPARANKKIVLWIVEAHSSTRENISKNTSVLLLCNIQWNHSSFKHAVKNIQQIENIENCVSNCQRAVHCKKHLA